MKKKIPFYFFIFIITLSGSPVFIGAQSMGVRFSFGLVQPSGEGSKYWESGYSIGLNGYIQLYPIFLTGVQVSFLRMEVDSNAVASDYPSPNNLDISGSYSVVELVPYVRVYSSADPDNFLAFFAQFGTGFYIVITEISVNGTANSNPVDQSMDETEYSPGITIGAGVLIGKKSGLQFEVFPQYNIIFTKGETTKYFSFGIGILF